MDITIHPSKLNGEIRAIPSKSQAHRLLICAALSDRETIIQCPETNQDIEATVRCLNALGAHIQRTELGYKVIPITKIPKTANLDCGESGSTLRFLLPVVCALGLDAMIHLSGRLPDRPLSPLWEELVRMGCVLTRQTKDVICTKGKLNPGEYRIPGNISSQFVSGLLFALPLLNEESKIEIIGELESKPYVDMTQEALLHFGITTEDFCINGVDKFRSPGMVCVEGDWSNAAFFLTAAGLGHKIRVTNLNLDSLQGDRAVVELLKSSDEMPVISAADIPDLVPILAVYLASRNGGKITDISRLRLKESNRVAAVENMLKAMGVEASSDENTMVISSGRFHGGVVDTCNDHRIAMAAAIAATVASDPVTVLGAECVAKSYPMFWQDYRYLGGKYEQYIR